MRIHLTVYRDPQGVSELSLDAADLPTACQQAETQGYKVIASKVLKAGQGLSLAGLSRFSGARFAVPLFAQELLALLDAGMGLVESIDILARKAKQDDARHILHELQRRAQPPRLPAGHPAANAEGAGLVRGGQDHATPGAATDGDRLPAQGRVEQLLHGRVEGVEVRVQDRRAGRHRLMVVEHLFER